MFDKLCDLITRDIFKSDMVFFFVWISLNYFRETFAMFARWGVLCCHLWANVKFHLIIRAKIATIYYFFNTDQFIANFFQKNTEWVRGFMGSLAYLTWLLLFLGPIIIEFFLDRKYIKQKK